MANLLKDALGKANNLRDSGGDSDAGEGIISANSALDNSQVAYYQPEVWYDFLPQFAMGIGAGFTVALVIFAMLRFERIREFLSPLYRLLKLPKDIMALYEEQFAQGRFELTMPRAVLIGFCAVAFAMFAGMLASSFVDLIGMLSTVALSS